MRNSESGNILTEYGVVIGLLAVASILVVMTMGGNISDLLGNPELTSKGSTADKMSLLDFGGGKVERLKKGDYNEPYYEIVFDENGIPHFVASRASSSTSIATTDHGDGFFADTLALAQQLDALASKYEKMGMTEEAMKLRKAADAAFYLAGAEGELDAIKGLQIPPVDGLQYSKDNALRDVLHYKDQLKAFINDGALMAKLEPADRIKAAAYAADSYNIAQKYANGLGDFITKDGYVAKNFAYSVQGNAGTGTAGSSIKIAEQGLLTTAYNEYVPANMMGYSDYFSPDEMRVRATAALAERTGSDDPISVTITSGILQDKLASSL